jgi:hypothetical protein
MELLASLIVLVALSIALPRLKNSRLLKRFKWVAITLIVANEIRGIAVVAPIGPPILKAILH